MRSKYEVTPEARLANATPTLEAFGLSFDLNANVFNPNYSVRLSDAEIEAAWPRLSNEPFPGIVNIGAPRHINHKTGDYEGPQVNSVNGVRLFRNAGRKGTGDVPYTVLTIEADRAAELIANGAAEGKKLQPAIAG